MAARQRSATPLWIGLAPEPNVFLCVCLPVFSDVQVGLASKRGLLGQQLFCTCSCTEYHAMKSQCPIKEMEESCTFIRIEGESPLGHLPTGFSLSRFRRAQPPFSLNFRPHVALFRSPSAHVLGRYSLPELPTTYFPLEPVIFPQSSEAQDCADPLVYFRSQTV